MNALREQSGKQFRQPWTAGVHERAGFDSRRVARLDSFDSIVDARPDGRLDYALHRPARHQYAAVGLEHSPRDGAEVDLRIALLELRASQFLEAHFELFERALRA